MIIGVAGPYSASTFAEKRKNLDALNSAAAQLLALGHVPIVGVNAALPVVEKLTDSSGAYDAVMNISCAVMTCCEALLLLGESPGALRERDLIVARGLPVYERLEDVPHP